MVRALLEAAMVALLMIGAVDSTALAAGLPQLDATKFAPQVIWLFLSFAIFYLLMARLALPRINRVLEERQRRIDDGLAKAESLRDEAARVLEAYEAAIDEARTEARTIVRTAAAEFAETSAKRQGELAERLGAEIAQGEQRIAEAKERALANIRDAAIEIARAASEKLVGEAADETVLGGAVDHALKDRAR
ncbi:MAG: F0F1 ATP synthase subunit B' [Rhodospirillales bacterium]|jgi:F-type H+-transporting ATPase subunit b|nr:F0F1 ATP synthase subunit B' [Rhodospirillales bacterium]